MSHLIPHEQTKSNSVCIFQTLDAVFPKDLSRLFIAKKKNNNKKTSKMNSLPVSFYCRKCQSSRPFLTIIAKPYISYTRTRN